MDPTITRRTFLGGIAGVGMAGVAASGAAGVADAAQSPAAGQRSTGVGRRLPPRGEFVIRRAYLVTMDAGLGDITDADVHVRNGEILAVGRNLRAPGATAIRGMRPQT